MSDSVSDDVPTLSQDEFEEYNSDEDGAGVQEVISAMRGLQSVAEEGEEECAVQDRPLSGAASRKLANLRQQARQQLGGDFDAVYRCIPLNTALERGSSSAGTS